MTLADFKVTAGIAPDARTHEHEHDGLLVAHWPGVIDRRDGWWWALATPGGTWLAGGWGAGTARDRDIDIARAVAKRLPSRAA